MSVGNWVYAAGILVLYLARRLSAVEEMRWSLTLLGALIAYVGAGGLRLRAFRKATDPGVRTGHRVALACLLLSFVGVLMYGATTDEMVASMSMSDQSEERWIGAWSSAWPLVWLLGTIPLFVVDHAIESSPVMMPVRRVHHVASHALVVAMGIGLVFPLNYVASKHNERWDLAYFKTPTPGSATHAIVESLEQPVDVRIFMPPSSEVALELRAYFAEIEGPNIRIEIIDQAAYPRLAKALTVRDNGTVAFTVGEVDLERAAPLPGNEGEPPPQEAEEQAAPVTRTLRVDDDFDKAKRTLRKIDAEVQRILIELGHGERIAYVTTGHGELTWQGNTPIVNRSMRGFKDDLKKNGFTVRPLGLRQDLGDAVPEDADVVMILGPIAPFAQAEVDSLRRYVDAGGSVLVAFETDFMRQVNGMSGPDPLHGWVQSALGVSLAPGVLAGDKAVYPMSRDTKDKLNIITNSFTSHPSSRTIADNSATEFIVAPLSGALEPADGSDATVTFTARSLAVHWADLNGDFEFKPEDGEAKDARNMVAAVEGGGDTPWRGIVAGGSTMFSDLVMGNRGNQMYAEDMTKWLVGAESLSGTTESEEDVKIEHTKEGQSAWFYITVLGMPLLVLVLGALRIRVRRTGRLRVAKRGDA